MTSKLPPSDGYSFESELKQCGHEAMTFFTPAPVKRLDVLLRLHLVQVLVAEPAHRVARAGLGRAEDGEASRRPGAAGGRCDWVVLRARSSRAPAHPTQKRYSTSSGIVPSTTGTSKSRLSVHSSRFAAPRPQGSPRFSTLRSMAPASVGKRGLDQHLVAAHVDDGVDVLDVDRALLDAGAARRARPEHVVGDDVGHERLLARPGTARRADP